MILFSERCSLFDKALLAFALVLMGGCGAAAGIGAIHEWNNGNLAESVVLVILAVVSGIFLVAAMKVAHELTE